MDRWRFSGEVSILARDPPLRPGWKTMHGGLRSRPPASSVKVKGGDASTPGFSADLGGIHDRIFTLYRLV